MAGLPCRVMPSGGGSPTSPDARHPYAPPVSGGSGPSDTRHSGSTERGPYSYMMVNLPPGRAAISP